jgi:hypothetical protein
VDSEGEVLDILIQPRRDCNPALKLMPGRCVGGRCEIIRLDPMLLNPLITNRNRRALGDEWRDGYRVVTVLRGPSKTFQQLLAVPKTKKQGGPHCLSVTTLQG